MAIKDRNERREVKQLPLVPASGQETRKLGEQLKVRDLVATHKLYKYNINEWNYQMAMYEGIREIVKMRLIQKHEREPQDSYDRRIKNLYSLGYTKSVVEIFQHFLFKKNPQERQLGKLHDDELWGLFYEDADLFGDSYESTMMEISLYASILGHMGILVDKANAKIATRKEEIDNRVYPYIAKYFPQAILDWDYARDEYNRPFLNYLKLEDDNGQYRLWSPEKWETWELPKDKNGMPDKSNMEADAIRVDEGENPLGEIPFVWLYNFKSRHRGIGKSDVHEISHIDLSIIANMSQVEEIINFAAFPMMRKPMRDAKPTDINAPQQDDEVSVQAVLEFDPENPDSKPDWLEAKVKDSISAIWEVVQGKVSEIYRAANIGGLAATEPTKDAQSGVAKQTDFQLLNAKLVNKAINLENAENSIVELWTKWQKQWDEMKDEVKMSRPKSFDVEALQVDLANALTAKTVVISKMFNGMIQKQATRQALPGANERELAQIDKEIDEAVEKQPLQGTGFEENMDNEDQPFVTAGGQPAGNNQAESNSNDTTTAKTGEDEDA